jgi:hypothetical protein
MDPHRLTLIYDDSTQPILIKFNQWWPNLGRRRFGEPYPKAARTGAHNLDTTEPPAWFYYFLGFLRIFLYRKSQGLGLWITGPRLSLSPWWTHDTGAAWPLRGSGGCRDSLERERGIWGRRGFHQWRHLEVELRRWPHDGAPQMRVVVLRLGDGSGCVEERLEPGWV